MVILFGARAFWDPDETSRSSFMDVFFFAFLVSTALYLTFVGSITFMGRVAVWCCEEVRRTKAKLAQIPPTLNMPWQLGFWLDCIMNSFGVAAAVVIVVYAHLDVAIMCTHDTDASCEFLKNIYGLGVLGPVLFIAALGFVVQLLITITKVVWFLATHTAEPLGNMTPSPQNDSFATFAAVAYFINFVLLVCALGSLQEATRCTNSRDAPECWTVAGSIVPHMVTVILSGVVFLSPAFIWFIQTAFMGVRYHNPPKVLVGWSHEDTVRMLLLICGFDNGTRVIQWHPNHHTPFDIYLAERDGLATLVSAPFVYKFNASAAEYSVKLMPASECVSDGVDLPASGYVARLQVRTGNGLVLSLVFVPRQGWSGDEMTTELSKLFFL